MKYSEAKQGRVFVIRLEDGDVVHEVIEAFAAAHGITAATLIAVGGADDGSRLVVGPAEDRARPVVPMQTSLNHAHEVAGVGTLFPGPDGTPSLHMHPGGTGGLWLGGGGHGYFSGSHSFCIEQIR